MLESTRYKIERLKALGYRYCDLKVSNVYVNDYVVEDGIMKFDLFATITFYYESTPYDWSAYGEQYDIWISNEDGAHKIVKLDSENRAYNSMKNLALKACKNPESPTIKEIQAGVNERIKNLPTLLSHWEAPDENAIVIEPKDTGAPTRDSVRHSFSVSAAAKYGRAFGRVWENGIFNNMAVIDPEGGGDCANFVSQCIWAGYGGTSGYTINETCQESSTALGGWRNLTSTSIITALKNRVANNYLQIGGTWMGRNADSTSYATGEWMRTRELGTYISENTGLGPRGTLYNHHDDGKAWTSIPVNIKKGDVLQYYGCNDKKYYDHSVIVVTCGADDGYSPSELWDDPSLNIKIASHTDYHYNMMLYDNLYDNLDNTRSPHIPRVRLLRLSAGYFNE